MILNGIIIYTPRVALDFIYPMEIEKQSSFIVPANSNLAEVLDVNAQFYDV